ncbi:uncharacterized protein C16orf96 homolog [Amia ocellicauda]|uniref:uncharacterized protein C16orf96 homolog n=1 Tax=Amia ocellicauda TaxID=2972642 RepID=UPI0034648F4F
MSVSVTLMELVDLALGCPDPGSVNFTVLRSLLQGMLEELGIGAVKRDLPEIQGTLTGRELPRSAQTPGIEGLAVHRLAQRVAKLEQHLELLNQLPSTEALLHQTSPGATQSMSDVWQLLQLRRRTEANEDGVAKAMSVLGDLLGEVRSLRDSQDRVLTELEELRAELQTVSLQEVQDTVRAQEEQSEKMKQAEESLRSLCADLASFPRPEELLQWRHIEEALSSQSDTEMGPTEGSDRAGARLLQVLGGLPAEQQVLGEELRSLKEQLGQHREEMASKGVPDNLLASLNWMEEDLRVLKMKSDEEQHALEACQIKLQDFQAQSEKLSTTTEQLLCHWRDIQDRVTTLEQERDDYKRLGSGNSEAASEGQQDTVSQSQLSAVSQQLSTMLQDLLDRISTQDRDWQGILDKLLKDMDSKLDRMELAPLRSELEAGWRTVKQRLREAPAFDTDTPAGFRKQLFEKVNCLSCDRPARMLKGIHMVTVPCRPQRPVSAGHPGSPWHSWYYRRWPDCHPSRVSRSCGGVHTMGGVGVRRPPQPPLPQGLSTLYANTDPALQPYRKEEVDIIGTNGVLYRGRLELHLPTLPAHGHRDRTPRGESVTAD